MSRVTLMIFVSSLWMSSLSSLRAETPREKVLEGHYTCVTKNKTVGFTLFHTGNKKYSASLRFTTKQFVQTYSFQEVVDQGDEKYDAIPFEGKSYSLSFKAFTNKDGSRAIKGLFQVGMKIVPFECSEQSNFLLMCLLWLDILPKTHDITFPSIYKTRFKGKSWVLILQKASDQYSAKLSIGQEKQTIHFPTGFYDQKERMIYLTTKTSEGNLIHFRGKFSDNNILSGAYIIGGQGVLFENQSFSKYHLDEAS